MVASVRQTTRAAPPSWRFVQVFRPRRVLCSCVVNCGGKIIVETSQKWRLFFLDARALVLFRLLGKFRGAKRNGAAIDVAVRLISSLALLSSAREVDSGGEIAKATPPRQQRRSIISPPLERRRSAWMKNATGHITEVTAPRRHLVRMFRACLSFPSGWPIPPNR